MTKTKKPNFREITPKDYRKGCIDQSREIPVQSIQIYLKLLIQFETYYSIFIIFKKNLKTRKETKNDWQTAK